MVLSRGRLFYWKKNVSIDGPSLLRHALCPELDLRREVKEEGRKLKTDLRCYSS